LPLPIALRTGQGRAPSRSTPKVSQHKKMLPKCCAYIVAYQTFGNRNRDSVLTLWRAPAAKGVNMSALQGFVLGLIVSWIPSLIFLSCIAVQAGAQRHGRTSEVAKPIDRVVALRTP
jgi:hypothetical protein